MISRVYLKDCLSFNEVDLEFTNGLNVFTGPSGAGKSILMEAILSLFVLGDVKSDLGEVSLINTKIDDELYDIEDGDEITIKSIKKEKVRFFINNQSISKKNLSIFSSKLIKHLNLKDTSDFNSEKLLNFLDNLARKKNTNFIKLKNDFDIKYKELLKVKKELNQILEDESKIEDLKEFTKFEIDKIESIDPKVGEYDELIKIKKKLSQKEKLEESIKSASGIFEFNSSVANTLELMDIDSSFFDETMNELLNIFEKFNDSLYELEDIDIEDVLNRVEKLSSLQKRFGSIEEALNYKELKKKELDSYENISFEKSILEKKLLKLNKDIDILSKGISSTRKEMALVLQQKINYYLGYLYLSNAKIELKNKVLDSFGIDDVVFSLNGVNLDTISSGEFNRLRLALLTSMSEFDIVDNGILFLDEIDANLSGKESDAISKVLIKLAKSYQIFAISHQPQLTSNSQQHFLVDKINGSSFVRILKDDERTNEIARMISGEEITKEALSFAKNLLNK